MKSIRFEETMQGTWRPFEPPGAAESGFRFEVEACGEHLPKVARDGRLAISGTVQAEGLAASAPLNGTLEIDPLRRREIVYAFYFPSDEGRSIFFRGRKVLSLWRPVRSMTALYGTLYDKGAPIGRATLRFDLRDLLGFVASFRLAEAPDWVYKVDPPPEVTGTGPRR